MLAKQNYLQKKDLNMYSATPTHLYRKTKVLLKVTITKHNQTFNIKNDAHETDWFQGKRLV